MFGTLTLAGHGPDLRLPGRLLRPMAWVYGVAALVLFVYLISLVARGPSSDVVPLDGWGVVAFEYSAACLCLLATRSWHRDRRIPLILGLALLFWSSGDAALTLGGANPPVPGPADAFYLGFYPIAYVAVVLIMRRDAPKMVPATWLDGVVAGLGAAAICGSFAFSGIVHVVGGSPLAVATNLAYPVGDLLLLALVVGGTATLNGRPNLQWLMLAGACSTIAVGDTFNLLATSHGPSAVGSALNGIAWPTALMLMSASMWLRPEAVDITRQPRAPGFLLPGLGALGALMVLLVAALGHSVPLAIALAVATLLAAGLRVGFSAHSLRALTDERHRLSVTDHLTGLGNRRRLFNLLDEYFADQADPRTPRRDLSFLFVDLNHFKEINDSFGHAAGDELLRQLGPRLEAVLRAGDILVRVGGDELGVVVLNTDPEAVASVAERLIAKLRQPFLLNQVPVRISASIGVASAPADATDSAALVHCADLAMYRAKLTDSTFEVYRHQLDGDSNRLRLVDELRSAVERGEFVLHYQPQLELRSGRTPTVEALLRWPNARLGMVPPLEFLPLAEEAGLMRDLTAWVLDQSLAQCVRWREQRRPLTVSVNVSVTNLLDPGFVAMVRERLTHHRLPASALILEITETTIIRDFEACKAILAELRELGLGISIDDFGAGFTSLAYLANLAVTELKLDRSFITRLSSDKDRDLAVVAATIELGHALRLRVVAEGVEDLATLDLLAQVGCDLAQGYYISRPVPAEELRTQPSWGVAERQLADLRAS